MDNHDHLIDKVSSALNELLKAHPSYSINSGLLKPVYDSLVRYSRLLNFFDHVDHGGLTEYIDVILLCTYVS